MSYVSLIVTVFKGETSVFICLKANNMKTEVSETTITEKALTNNIHLSSYLKYSLSQHYRSISTKHSESLI